jgi:hypothetical protein
MRSVMRQIPALVGAAALFIGATVACAGDAPAAAAMGPNGPQAPAPGKTVPTQDIQHLEPRPDFVGPQPARFAWSRVEGADSYTLRIWNEADVRVLSESGLTTTTVDFPKENDMPAGTYFWAIVGMRGDAPIAESGMAAFVVQKP